MNEIPPVSDKPISNWTVAVGAVSFALLYLLWALGFDAVADWLSGGGVEALLNWVSRSWLWLVWAAVPVAFVLTRLSKDNKS